MSEQTTEYYDSETVFRAWREKVWMFFHSYGRNAIRMGKKRSARQIQGQGRGEQMRYQIFSFMVLAVVALAGPVTYLVFGPKTIGQLYGSTVGISGKLQKANQNAKMIVRNR